MSNNLTSIFAKLEVSDRAAAIIRAREGGLGGSGSSPVTPEISSTVLVGVAVAGLAWLAGGLALLAVGRARLAAVLLTGAGVAMLAGTVLSANGQDTPAWFAVVAAAGLLVPLALTAYPLLRWRHPVDFVALVVIAGGGALMALQARDATVVGALGMVMGVVFFAHTWWRIERSVDRERRALIWMALTVGSVGMLDRRAELREPDRPGRASCRSRCSGCSGPALYVGVALPDIVDVRALVVTVVVFTVAAITYLGLFMSVASLLEMAAGETPTVGALAVVGALVGDHVPAAAGRAARRRRRAAVRPPPRPARRRERRRRPDRRGPRCWRCARSARRWSCRTPHSATAAGRWLPRAHPRRRPARSRCPPRRRSWWWGCGPATSRCPATTSTSSR